MTTAVAIDELRYPFEAHPQPNEVFEVAPGLMWVRLKLPFRLNHVNIYLIADDDGWAMMDTGFGDDVSIAAWNALFDGPLKSFRITRVIITHAHPDHIGLAGWMVERWNCPLYITPLEYYSAAYHKTPKTQSLVDSQRAFFKRHGMNEDVLKMLLGAAQDYLKRVTELPPAYVRLSDGDSLTIGNRVFRVFTGGGHSLNQAMLYCEADNIFLSADQVLSKISPNVSVWATEPDANPLGLYLNSLKRLSATLPHDVMVLPAHGVPFYGIRTRIQQLIDHHEERCGLIGDACRHSPKTTAELVPVVFHHLVLDAHQTGFAASEVIAHINYMMVEGRLKAQTGADGVMRFIST